MFLTVALVIGSGCSERPAHLAGDYYLVDSDDSHVYIINHRTNTIAVNDQVVDTATDAGLIFVLRQKAQSYECTNPNGERVIATRYYPELDYWIIDQHSGKTLGPLNKPAFARQLEKAGLDVPELSPSSYFVRPNAKVIQTMKKEGCGDFRRI